MTLPTATPGTLTDLKLDVRRWETVERLAAELVQQGTLPAVSLQVLANGHRLKRPLQFGRQRLHESSPALADNAIFLVASLTKPVVAMGILLLLERGKIALNDRVVDLLPEFDAAPRRPMLVRHLLTHTSGLPDMLPNNRQLRQSNRPLSAFFEGTCAVTLDYPPGHGVQYQSMGFVLLAEIIKRISGLSCGQFLQQEVFAPLEMHDTVLGAPDDWFVETSSHRDRIVEVRVPDEQQEGIDWNWNSRYWRQIGAPWGGLLTTTEDLANFCTAILQPGLFAQSTLQAATSNQLRRLSGVSEVDRRTRGWGLGWRLNWVAHPATFGDLLGPHVVGHWGATGTLFWIDRDRQTACIVLSTQPLDRGRNHLVRLSNAVVAAVG